MEKRDLELGEVDVIQDTFQSLLDCVKDEDNHKNRVKPSIYMAPSILRNLSPSSFTPRLISIGPLHREDENVQAFEKRKISYLINLIQNTNSPQEEILKSCVERVHASMERIKACYVWTKTYDDVEVAKMMVMDACFILQFLLNYPKGAFDELCLGNAMLIQTIKFDLVLLENQIPFFILNEIFQCTILKFRANISLVEFFYPFLRSHKIFKANIKTENISVSTTDHILSLLHQCYKPQNTISSKFLSSRINSAVDLDRAGIKFEPNQNPTWVLGMEVVFSTFHRFFGSWCKPTIRMPVLLVGDSGEMVFRNLIAYEQSCNTHNHITSYVYTMGMLVNTVEDVSKLADSGVLINFMGPNEDVAKMLHNIGKRVECQDFFYGEQLEILNEYCNSYWPKHIARIRSTYFSSPWNMIALLAGIVLFILTVVQTIFTIVSAVYKTQLETIPSNSINQSNLRFLSRES